MTTIKYNLFALKRQLELKTGRSYTWKEIADAAQAHPNTLQNIAGNKTARIDMGVVAGLIDFFNENGLPVTLSDLFIVNVSDSVKVGEVVTIKVQPPVTNSIGITAAQDPGEPKNSL